MVVSVFPLITFLLLSVSQKHENPDVKETNKQKEVGQRRRNLNVGHIEFFKPYVHGEEGREGVFKVKN